MAQNLGQWLASSDTSGGGRQRDLTLLPVGIEKFVGTDIGFKYLLAVIFPVLAFLVRWVDVESCSR